MSNDEDSNNDEYVDDDDPGFDLYECEAEYFNETCKKLSDQYGFPKRAVCKTKKSKKDTKDTNKGVLHLF